MNSKTHEAIKKMAYTKLINDNIKKHNSCSFDENIFKLSSYLRDKGYTKYAEDLEKYFLIYKKSETALYNLSEQSGEDTINEAHTESGQMQGFGENGLIENNIEQHEKITNILKKKSLNDISNKLTNAVKQLKLNKIYKLSQENNPIKNMQEAIVKLQGVIKTTAIGKDGHVQLYNTYGENTSGAFMNFMLKNYSQEHEGYKAEQHSDQATAGIVNKSNRYTGQDISSKNLGTNKSTKLNIGKTLRGKKTNNLQKIIDSLNILGRNRFGKETKPDGLWGPKTNGALHTCIVFSNAMLQLQKDLKSNITTDLETNITELKRLVPEAYNSIDANDAKEKNKRASLITPRIQSIIKHFEEFNKNVIKNEQYNELISQNKKYPSSVGGKGQASPPQNLKDVLGEGLYGSYTKNIQDQHRDSPIFYIQQDLKNDSKNYIGNKGTLTSIAVYLKDLESVENFKRFLKEKNITLNGNLVTESNNINDIETCFNIIFSAFKSINNTSK